MSDTMHLTADRNTVTDSGNVTAGGAAATTTQREHDGGWTLIELLLVVLILGILSSVVVFGIGGMRAEASNAGCDADNRSLGTAVESYFAETGGTTIPANGTDHDRFEQTLVDGGFLRNVSEYHDLDATGAAIPEGNSSC